MTIAETREKCKGLVGRIPRDVLILAVLILASSASFGLGFLAGKDVGQGSAFTPEELLPALQTADRSGAVPDGGEQFVASKNGTKYYFAGCAGADRISVANKVWFSSKSAAAAAGYTRAANCKVP